MNLRRAKRSCSTTTRSGKSFTDSCSRGSQPGVTNVRITENGQVYNPVIRLMSRFVLGHTRTMDIYLYALGKATGQEVEIKD